MDNVAVEVSPAEIEGTTLLFHMLALREMGMMLGEMWDPEALAADCAQDKVYEFMLVAQPLLLPGAVGSPVNSAGDQIGSWYLFAKSTMEVPGWN